MKNKKLLISSILLSIFIFLFLVSYAFWTYNRSGTSQELVLGDIYMHYDSSDEISIDNALPGDDYKDYFEFTISGKNTYTEKDIWYDIKLLKGDVPSGKSEDNRLDDKYLKFKLTEVVDGVETEIFTDKRYANLDEVSVYVEIIPASSEEYSKTYRLYMALSEDLLIGNIEGAMSSEEFKNSFANIEVKTTGDFNEKEIDTSYVANKPKTGLYCSNITYNGETQTLVKNSGLGYTFINTTGVDAGSYEITAKLNDGYLWEDGTSEDYIINCSIKQKSLTIVAKAQSLDGVNEINTDLDYITVDGLIDGDSVSSITLTQSTNEDTTDGTITPSDAKIVSGTTDVSSNYKITYKTGKLAISTLTYTMVFNINGASKIDGKTEDSVSVSCKPGSSSSCDVTTLSITPATNYEVLGWSTSSDATTSKYSVNQTISLTEENSELFAITKSTDASRSTNYITFNLNGADSFTYNGTEYTNDTKVSCQTDYAYNGEAIPDSCTITLPTIKRSEGNVYGWSLDNESLTSDYSQSTSFEVFDETTLNAITSRTISVITNANGGTTTIGTLTGEAFNTESGAWFVLPSYDSANMCRTAINLSQYTNDAKTFSADGYLLGYKYIGLATNGSSTTVEYCPGNYIYLEEDTTLYALWNEDYATSLVTSGASLNLRTGCSTSYSKTGSSMSGSNILYIYQQGTAFSEENMGYWLKYGSRNGCASTKYIQPIKSYPEYNSCSRTDYVCDGGTVADITMTPSTMTLNLKDNTTGDIEVDSRCGTYTLASSDTSVATVSKVSGNTYQVSAVSGGVSENSKETVTITATGQWDCEAQTEVVVKNTNAVEPTVEISTTASTSCGDNCYKKGVEFTVTCSSPIAAITDFTVSGATITGDDNSKTATITYSSTGKKTITASCTNSEGTTTVSKTISVKTYSSSSSCGVSSYSYSGSYTCYNSAGTVSDTYSCNATRYSYGSASSYCKSVGYQGRSTGSCKRTATYKKCWHT